MVRTVDTLDEARRLAEWLLEPSRPQPVVVVSVPVAQTRPWVDVAEVETGVTGLAEVVVIRTGHLTWELQAVLPERTHVYGGASRVYPVDDTWQSDPYRSPLRFAYGVGDSSRVASLLVADAVQMAALSGAVAERRDRSQERDGTVRGLLVPTRALVDLDGTSATIHEELCFPGVPLERVVAPGMRIRGLHDPAQGVLDIRRFALAPEQALAAYEVGRVVLARVRSVHGYEAELELLPDVIVTVTLADVTGNPLDDLTSLLSVGEVLPARLAGHGQQCWAVSLLDVDDDEEVLPAASLLPGGPPWLEPSDYAGPREPLEDEDVLAVQQPSPSVLGTPTLSTRDGGLPRDQLPTAQPEDLRVHESSVQQPSIPVAPAQDDESGALRLELSRLREERAGLDTERTLLTARLRELEGRVRRSDHELERLRARVRQESGSRQRAQQALRQAGSAVPDTDTPLFSDEEEQFRYEVYMTWAERIPAGEKGDRPLPDYAIGPAFLQSLGQTEGVERRKVVDAVMQVVTGLAEQVPGREMHQLRTGSGGSDPPVTRESDGATCWRVSLQVNTPQARRLHFWRTYRQVELSRVVQHDDTSP